jgi:hypothetical protein
MANLEKLLYLKKRFEGSKNENIGSSYPMHETINLGTPEKPKNVKIDRTIFKEERRAYFKLFRQYQYVFAWYYRDLKT